VADAGYGLSAPFRTLALRPGAKSVHVRPGYTFRCRGMPTAQARLRAVSP
jgi:hypothetical protein